MTICVNAISTPSAEAPATVESRVPIFALDARECNHRRISSSRRSTGLKRNERFIFFARGVLRKIYEESARAAATRRRRAHEQFSPARFRVVMDRVGGVIEQVASGMKLSLSCSSGLLNRVKRLEAILGRGLGGARGAVHPAWRDR